MTTLSHELPVGPGKKWGWGKRIAVGLVGLIVFVAIIVFVVLRLTSPLTELGDGFFADLRQDRVEDAYARTSGPFKQATSLDQFRSFVSERQLDAVQSTNWGNRKISGAGDGATGELEGSITATDGSARALTMTFVKEQGEWRVQHLNLAAAGADTAASSQAIPEERELVRMTHDLVMAFSRSVKAKSMAEFHGILSERWAREQDVAALDQAFKPFTDADIDLSGLQNMTPIFDGTPAVDGNGWLQVKGHYASSPSRVTFETGYIQEGVGWKPGSFRINVAPEGQQ